MGSRVAWAPGSPASGQRGRRRAGGVGILLRRKRTPQSNSLAKTKRGGEGGPFQTFLVSLSDFKLARIAAVESPGPKKEGAQGLKIPSGWLGRRAPPRSTNPPLPWLRARSPSRSLAPRTTCPLPRDLGGSGGGQEPAMRGEHCLPYHTRGDRASSVPAVCLGAAARVTPAGLAGVPAGRTPPGSWFSCCLLLSSAAPWSGSVFSAHHHVHQLVARVQQPRRPEGAAPAAAAATTGAGDR
jgi:hypothetical protein